MKKGLEWIFPFSGVIKGNLLLHKSLAEDLWLETHTDPYLFIHVLGLIS
jgi:hypothetical protein